MLKQLRQASSSFGDANLVIKAINEYSSFVAVENEINDANAKKEQIQLDIQQYQASLSNIQKKTAQQQELFKSYKELKELGFDESSLKQIKEIAIRYGDVVGVGAAERNGNSIFNRNDDSNNNNNNSKRMSITKDFVNKAHQAFNKFADMSAIESQIKNLQGKRTDVETALNKVNSD
jgi:hypothetical protein